MLIWSSKHIKSATFPGTQPTLLLLLQKGSLLQRIMGLSIPHVEGSNGYPNGAAGATRSVADGTATKVNILLIGKF